MDRDELEGLDRESLVVRAQAAGIRRARILTRPELIDELLRLDPSADQAQLRKSRGFFGRARDLVARVVERGLHLPDAADRLRSLTASHDTVPPRPEPHAVPTVTLAEIYAAQGHPKRAIETLRRVLEREPDHTIARALLSRLEDEAYVPPPPLLPPEADLESPYGAHHDAELVQDANLTDNESQEQRNIGGPLEETEVTRDDFTVLNDSETALEAASQHGKVDDSEELPDATLQGQRAIEQPEDLLVPMFLDPEVMEEPTLEEFTKSACVAIPVAPASGGARTFVRWYLSQDTVGTFRQKHPRGRFVVRAYVVTPSWNGPRTETRDYVTSAETGWLLLQGLPELAIVRVAVGWADADDFIPIEHSPALEFDTRGELVIWTPNGRTTPSPEDPMALTIALALDDAKRASLVESPHA